MYNFFSSSVRQRSLENEEPKSRLNQDELENKVEKHLYQDKESTEQAYSIFTSSKGGLVSGNTSSEWSSCNTSGNSCVSLERIKDEILAKLRQESESLENINHEDLLNKLKNLSTIYLLRKEINFDERRQLLQELMYKLRGLGVLEEFLADDEITEIMVNAWNKIFFEKKGQLFRSKKQFQSPQDLNDVIHKIFTRCNRKIDILHPIADAVLEDGSRVNAILSPICVEGPCLTIRKFCGIKPSLDYLLEQGCITKEAIAYLQNLVATKKSVFICGGTGSGKTTLLNILTSFIPKTERVISIEDVAELNLQSTENWLRLEARQALQEQLGEIHLTQLIKTALRMRPDRIIVGEIRGEEAVQLIHAANTGHPGSLSTGHANSCADMVLRLANLIFSASQLPYSVILQLIIGAFPYFIEVRRLENGCRRIMEISEALKVKGNQVFWKTHFKYDPKEDCLCPYQERNC